MNAHDKIRPSLLERRKAVLTTDVVADGKTHFESFAELEHQRMMPWLKHPRLVKNALLQMLLASNPQQLAVLEHIKRVFPTAAAHQNASEDNCQPWSLRGQPHAQALNPRLRRLAEIFSQKPILSRIPRHRHLRTNQQPRTNVHGLSCGFKNFPCIAFKVADDRIELSAGNQKRRLFRHKKPLQQIIFGSKESLL